MQIKAEQGIASGIRRIEAVAGPAALDFLNERDAVVREMTGQFKVAPAELPAKLAGMQQGSVVDSPSGRGHLPVNDIPILV